MIGKAITDTECDDTEGKRRRQDRFVIGASVGHSFLENDVTGSSLHSYPSLSLPRLIRVENMRTGCAHIANGFLQCIDGNNSFRPSKNLNNPSFRQRS
jgi:hypothetical protein